MRSRSSSIGLCAQPILIGDVEVHRASARLAGADGSRRRTQGRETSEPGLVVGRGVIAHERTPSVVVRRREQRLERDLLGVAVQRVAIGECELSALDDHMDELSGRERRKVESLEERELLEPHRPRRPRRSP